MINSVCENAKKARCVKRELINEFHFAASVSQMLFRFSEFNLDVIFLIKFLPMKDLRHIRFSEFNLDFQNSI